MSGAPAETSLHAVLRERAAANPGVDAIVSEGGRVSFEALLGDVERAMWLLAREGLGPGMVAGVAIADTRLHLTAALAVAGLGSAQIGLPSYETDAANAALAERLGASLILCAEPAAWMEKLRPLPLSAAALAGAPRFSRLADPVPAAAPAVYVKTSGSTDLPKLFAASFERLAAAAGRCAAEEAERTVMRTSSIEFDSTRLYRLYGALGGRTAAVMPRDMADLGAFCRRFDVSQVHIGAYALGALLDGARASDRLPGSTALLTGGSRVPGAMRAEVARRLSDALFVSYATSEIGVISLARPDEHAAFPEGVGRPRPDVTVEILGEDGSPVAPGEVGEIRVRRPVAPTGYVGREADSPQFRDGWFYPRDLIAWPEGGPLVYHGRSDDVMMLNGVKVSPEPIEDALAAHPAVKEAAAFALASRVHGEIPAAAVVLADRADADAPSLLAYCRRLLGIRGPRRIVLVESIPRTRTGKALGRELGRL